MSMISGSRDYERFDELAEEFARRYRQGERPSLQEYVDRLPEMADEIRELFPTFVEVEQVQEAHVKPEQLNPAAAGASPPPLGQVGDYSILREVGRGGMGVVYEAEQISLGRRVALKVLPRHVAKDRKTLERFRREARSAARLHHTNIVPVFEVGQDGDVVFYAMQFIQGQGLDLVIDELAQLRARSGATGANPGSASGRLRRESRVSGSLAFGECDDAECTLGDEAPASQRSLSLTRMAQSLLLGRFAIGEPDSAGKSQRPETAKECPTANYPERSGRGPTGGFLENDGRRATAATRAGDEPRVPEQAVFVRAKARPEGDKGADPSFVRFEGVSSAVLPGGTLISSAESSDGRRPFFRSVAQIGRQVALGLAYAHARGIVHRDIKPSNLLLDSAGVVWITDFGLAKAEDDGLTATGDILGTLRYMAPERFRGAGDGRADVYALGLTLYELLTLRPAFGASDRLRLIEQIKADEPARPRVVDHRIPRDLETIVLKATDKEPNRRYATAAAMGEDLRRFVEDEPIEARRASYPERLARWARHHKSIAVSLALFGVLLISVAVAASIAAARFRGIAKDKEKLAEQTEKERIKAVNAKAQADASRLVAEEERVKALDAKAQADVSRKLAEDEREIAVRTLYFAKVNLVSDALTSPQGQSLIAPFLMSWRRLCVRNDPRAWEWYYLQSPPAHELLTLRGHNVDVMAVAVSPDGQRIASGGFDDLIRIWDASTGKQVMSIMARGRGVLSLGWSPDGTKLAEASTDRWVRVWDAALGLNLVNLAHADEVHTVAWSPDGSRLASASRSEPTQIWDASSGRLLVKLKQSDASSHCAWSPDGSRMVGFTKNETNLIHLAVWDAATGLRLAQFGAQPAEAVVNVAWSPAGAWIASASGPGGVRLWDAATGKEMRALRGKGSGFDRAPVAWSKDGTRLASGNEDGQIATWSAADWRPGEEYRGTSKVKAIAWLPDGKRLVSGHGGWNGEVKVWSALPRSSANLTTCATTHTANWTIPLAWNPTQSTIALGNGTGTVDVWDTATGRKTSLPWLGEAWPTALDWSPDGTRIAVGLSEPGFPIKLIDVATGHELAILRGLDSTVRAISWSPDGRRLAAGGGDYLAPRGRTAKSIVWNMDTFLKLAELAGSAAFFSPDGRRIAVADQYAVSIQDATTGQVLARWNHPSVLFWQLCWSPNGRFLAGKFEREAFVWEAATGRPVANLAGHSGAIKSFAWSPDGERLATASDDATVRLWDAHSGTPVFTLRGHESEVVSVAWSADGLKLASGAANGTVRIWDATAGSEIDRNPARLGALDRALAVDPANMIALRSRADLRARLQQWQGAANDYEHVARLSSESAPTWFQSGWWSATALTGVSGDSASAKQVLDPFDAPLDPESSPAGDPARPRWYAAAIDPGGYVPISAGPTYLMTRFFSTVPREVALVCDKIKLRAWMNGQRLRDAVPLHPVTLRRGWNTLITTYEVSPADAGALSQPRSGFYVRLSCLIADLAAAYLEYDQPDRAVEIATKALEPTPNDAESLLLAYRISKRCGEFLSRAGKHEDARQEEIRALSLLERMIAVRPDVSSLAAELASHFVRHGADWTVLEPVVMKSAGGATLTRLPDGSVLAGGANPDHETYTVTAKTRLKRISGFRLEAMQHPSLPNGGPGRHEVGVIAPVGLDVQSDGLGDAHARTAVFGSLVGISPLTSIIQAADGTGDGRELTLTFVINQKAFPRANLGRFRVSATTFPDLDLLLAILANPPRTKAGTLSAVAAAKLFGGNTQPAIAGLDRGTGQSASVRVTDDLLSYLAHKRLGDSEQARSSLRRGLDQIVMERPEEEELLPIVLVKALSEALKTAPDDLRMLTLRAKALQWLGRQENAGTDYARAARLDPGNPEWPRRIAQLRPGAFNGWNFDFDADGWKAESDVDLAVVSGSFVRVEGTGDNPRIAVAVTVPAGKLKFTIRARLKQPIHARLSWSERAADATQGPVAAKCSQQFEMTPTNGDWREFDVAINPEAPLVGLRLETGGNGSKLDIDSIVLRSSAE